MSLECANQIFKIPTIHGNKKGSRILLFVLLPFSKFIQIKICKKVHIKIHHSLFIENTSFLNFELMLEKCLYFTVISPFSLINFTLLFPLLTLLLFNTR